MGLGDQASTTAGIQGLVGYGLYGGGTPATATWNAAAATPNTLTKAGTNDFVATTTGTVTNVDWKSTMLDMSQASPKV